MKVYLKHLIQESGMDFVTIYDKAKIGNCQSDVCKRACIWNVIHNQRPAIPALRKLGKLFKVDWRLLLNSEKPRKKVKKAVSGEILLP